MAWHQTQAKHLTDRRHTNCAIQAVYGILVNIVFTKECFVKQRLFFTGATYTANLASFLIVKRFVSPIESVEDLARQSKIEYGLPANGQAQMFFQVRNVRYPLCTRFNNNSFLRSLDLKLFM